MDPKLSLDTDRIDDAVLALLLLGICDRDRFSGAARAWKSFNWDAMDRLHEKGLIDDPVSKAKSVWITEEGMQRAEALFQELFTKPGQASEVRTRRPRAEARRDSSADGRSPAS
jgi:hypothetical protein